MKFDNYFNLKNFFANLSLFIILTITLTSATTIQTNRNIAIDKIQTQLDDLITKLEKNHINKIQPVLSENPHSALKIENSNIKGLDFSDEVIDAFQSLNHDFLEYENILSSDAGENNSIVDEKISKFQQENNRIKNLFEKNEKNFKLLCSLHEENSKMANSTENVSNSDDFTKRYYAEIENLTNDITQSFESFDKIEKIDEKRNLLKQKLAYIQDIKKSLFEMKAKINLIHKNKSLMKEKTEKIKETTNKILNLYNDYLNLEKSVNSKAIIELDNLKKSINKSKDADKSIKDYINIYGELSNFYKKINFEENSLVKEKKEEELNKRFELFGQFLTRISQSDQISIQLSSKIEQNIENIKKNSIYLSSKKRIEILNKYLSILKSLKDFNEKILTLKEKISEKLKKYSFSSLNELVAKINEKQTSNAIKHQKLTHVKNAFDMIKNIFQNKNLIEKTKEKIIQNIENVNLIKSQVYKKNSLAEQARKIKEEKNKILIFIGEKIEGNENKLREIQLRKEKISQKKNIIKQIEEEKEKIDEKYEEIQDKKNQLENKKKLYKEADSKIKDNTNKIKSIHNARDQINLTKSKLIELAKIKEQEKRIHRELSELQTQRDLIMKQREKAEKEEERLRQEEEEEERRIQEEIKKEQIKDSQNQFFLQKLEQIQGVKNRTETTQKMITMHHDLINKLVNVLLYLKQLKETHRHIRENKERIVIVEKIKQARGIIQEMKQVIENTKRILEQQDENRTIQEGYDSAYNQLIEKVESLKNGLKNAESVENINNFREKLRKLTNLYKILKTGTAHNALRNELMKKLVNINSSMLQNVNIFKLQNEINLLK